MTLREAVTSRSRYQPDAIGEEDARRSKGPE
jgi:hypothetical protein